MKSTARSPTEKLLARDFAFSKYSMGNVRQCKNFKGFTSKITCNGIYNIFITNNFFHHWPQKEPHVQSLHPASRDHFCPSDNFLVIFDKNICWIVDAYLGISLFGNQSLCKNHVEIECVPRIYDRYPAFHKGATRPICCCKNLLSGGSRVLPSLAALAWDRIAARSAYLKMKRNA